LAGGLALGLLSSMPYIQFGNYFCCMWVVGGGALSSYFLLKQRPTGIRYGDGAFGGVLSGFVGAFVATLISVPVRIMSAAALEAERSTFEDLLRQAQIEGPLHNLLMRIASPEISVVTVLFTFISNLLIFALFGMIGGILMVALVEKGRV